MPFIEKDALNTPDAPDKGAFLVDDHAHTDAHAAPLKSFIATPRHDPTLMQRFRSLFKSELKPGQTIVKGADGLRYMFIITSNSYEDRDNETITSEALKAYEASCFPGEGLFHCDNPLLFWHDDDVPMGEIVAVNYSEPFLVEVAKELPTPTARVLWDYAEANGDKAGASHRFGYRDEDRQDDGSYTHILKQESSYLPERNLAANLMTYAGVMKDMSTNQSDAWLNKIFGEATGGKITDAAKMIHAKSGALDKELAKLGITHKAKAEGDTEAEIADAAETAAEDAPVEDTKAETPAEFGKWLDTMNQIYTLIMSMVDAQSGMMDDSVEMAKEIKALKEANSKEKAHSDTLEKRVSLLEAKLALSQKRASQSPETDIDLVKQSLEDTKKAADDQNLVDSIFGKIKPPIDYSNRT